MITVEQLAAELGGLRPKTARRIALAIGKELGITPSRRQVSERSPKRLCWTREQADAILAARERDGYRTARQPLGVQLRQPHPRLERAGLPPQGIQASVDVDALPACAWCCSPILEHQQRVDQLGATAHAGFCAAQHAILAGPPDTDRLAPEDRAVKDLEADRLRQRQRDHPNAGHGANDANSRNVGEAIAGDSAEINARRRNRSDDLRFVQAVWPMLDQNARARALSVRVQYAAQRPPLEYSGNPDIMPAVDCGLGCGRGNRPR
jgi:hypothetical protein